MKSKLKNLIAFILVIILGAAAAVTGFAVSAASDATVTTRSDTKKDVGSHRSALRGGIWQVLYKTGVTKLLAVDAQAQTATLIPADPIRAARISMGPDLALKPNQNTRIPSQK